MVCVFDPLGTERATAETLFMVVKVSSTIKSWTLPLAADGAVELKKMDHVEVAEVSAVLPEDGYLFVDQYKFFFTVTSPSAGGLVSLLSVSREAVVGLLLDESVKSKVLSDAT